MIFISFNDDDFYSLSHSYKCRRRRSYSYGRSNSYSNGSHFSFRSGIVGSLDCSRFDFRNSSRSRSWRNAY